MAKYFRPELEVRWRVVKRVSDFHGARLHRFFAEVIEDAVKIT
jgi:hypothetical protein